MGQPFNNILENLNIQTGFFGSHGLTLEEGLTDLNLNEVAMKMAMVERCRRVVGVLDASKWGKVAAATFAPLDSVHTIISDTKAPTDLVDQLRQQQIDVILA